MFPHTHTPKAKRKARLLLLTGGDIKHIFLLQFYAIESRKVPIFRYQSHKKSEPEWSEAHLNHPKE